MKGEMERTLSRANFLITDSEYVRLELIKKFDWNPERVAAIPLGVSEDYHPRTAAEVAPVLERYGLLFNRYTLCVSTIEPRKNLNTLLASYARLSDQTKASNPLVLVGGKGWDCDETYAKIAKAQSEGWLKYLGYIPEMHLPAIYAGARSFVYPSLYEGFGLPVAEAISSGVPVLTSDSSSLAEVAGPVGLSVDPLDVVRMSELLLKMIEDEQWREEIQPQLASYGKCFNWTQTVQRTASVYRQVSAEL